MKATMRKRYVSIKTSLDRANKDMATGKYGILAIDNLIKAEASAGKLLYEMLFCDQGNDEDLQPLISKRVLLHLIYATADNQEAIKARINQEQSRHTRKKRLALLYDWLDQNIHKYKGRLEDCAEDAVQQIAGLDMAVGTVKKHITTYRREKGLAGGESANKSTKKRK